jgi:hypothetical protein
MLLLLATLFAANILPDPIEEEKRLLPMPARLPLPGSAAQFVCKQAKDNVGCNGLSR